MARESVYELALVMIRTLQVELHAMHEIAGSASDWHFQTCVRSLVRLQEAVRTRVSVEDFDEHLRAVTNLGVQAEIPVQRG